MIWKLTNNKQWEYLENQFDWVRDMKSVKQSSFHHAEGTVDIHTQMVLNELYKLPSYKILDEQHKEILWASALLHDVEKRSTSVDEGNGVITSKGHAKKGEFTARKILYIDIKTPFNIRENIVSLVRLHGFPLWLMEKNNPQKELLEASLRVDLHELKILAEADARGRKCEDLGSLLDSMELFEAFCVEQGCWKQNKVFASNGAKFHYFNNENSYVDYVPFDNFKCNVILMSGLPGMGKDHYIKSYNIDLPVVSLDAIRRKHKLSPTDKSANGWVVQTAKEEARVYLRKGQDFVWNATNITSMMRSQLIDLFVSYGAYVKIVYIEKSYDTWRKQNRERCYSLPENVLDRMLDKLEIPQLYEAHEVEYLI